MWPSVHVLSRRPIGWRSRAGGRAIPRPHSRAADGMALFLFAASNEDVVRGVGGWLRSHSTALSNRSCRIWPAATRSLTETATPLCREEVSSRLVRQPAILLSRAFLFTAR